MINARNLTATELIGAAWRKSSHSGSGEGQCVEVAANLAPLGVGVGVRDSKDPAGPALLFTSGAWSSFVEAVKRGELPL